MFWVKSVFIHLHITKVNQRSFLIMINTWFPTQFQVHGLNVKTLTERYNGIYQVIRRIGTGTTGHDEIIMYIQHCPYTDIRIYSKNTTFMEPGKPLTEKTFKHSQR